MKKTLIALAILTIGVTGLSYGVASWCVHRSRSPSVADVNDTAWLKRELQLTDAQGAQIDGLDKEFRAKLNQCCDAHCAARLTLSQELAKPQVDLAKASACVDRMAAAQSQSERDTLNHILRVRGVLTPEQQQRYATLVSQQVCMAGPFGDAASGTMKAILAVLIVSGWSAIVIAQTNDSLDALISTALTNNPEIAMAQRKWDAALQKVPQSRALEDPRVGVDTWRKGPGAESPSENGLMASQTLPWFGKRDLRGRVETGAAKQAEMAWRMKTLEVVAMVKQTYYDLWQAQREMDLNERDQELMRQFVEVARARYETGRTLQSDLIRAQNELAKLSEDRIDRVRAYQQALAELNRLVQRAPETPVEIGTEVAAPVRELSATLEQLEAAAEDRPELVGAREGAVRGAEAALALAQKGNYPDVEFRVEGWEYEGRGGIQEYDMGVSMNFPWVNRGKYRAAINEARANLEASRDDLDGMRSRTAAEVKKLYDGIETMHHHYTLYTDKLIPQQRLAVDAARAAYEAGGGGFLDVLDARRMLFDLEMQNLHHAAEFQRLLASLERVIGGNWPAQPAEGAK